MNARYRAAALGALSLLSVAIWFSSAAAAEVPEWQQDLDYLTWDRRLEESAAASGGPVYLQPRGLQTSGAGATTPAPIEAGTGWHVRIRDFYSLVTPRGWRTLVSRRGASEVAPTNVADSAPKTELRQPFGSVAQQNSGATATNVRR